SGSGGGTGYAFRCAGSPSREQAQVLTKERSGGLRGAAPGGTSPVFAFETNPSCIPGARPSLATAYLNRPGNPNSQGGRFRGYHATRHSHTLQRCGPGTGATGPATRSRRGAR